MNISPNYALIDEVAVAFKVDPSFIEKDWYTTKIMAIINALPQEHIQAVSCGVTSLSKCYGLLDRFSEGLDYRGVAADPNIKLGKGVKSRYRKALIEVINQIDGLAVIDASIDSGRNYFKFDVDYDKRFTVPLSLRQSLKVEFSFSQPNYTNGFKACKTRSLVDSYFEQESLFDTLCVSPIEIAADKLSALVWRVIKNQGSRGDPSLVRHLYDLVSLRDQIDLQPALFSDLVKLSFFDLQPALFSDLVKPSFSVDVKTASRSVVGSPVNIAKKALSIIKSGWRYKQDYQRYVEIMSFADLPATYGEAIVNFSELISTKINATPDQDNGLAPSV